MTNIRSKIDERLVRVALGRLTLVAVEGDGSNRDTMKRAGSHDIDDRTRGVRVRAREAIESKQEGIRNDGARVYFTTLNNLNGKG